MDKDKLATLPQKLLMMELGLKKQVGLTKIDAARLIEKAFNDGATPQSWHREPASQKQIDQISSLSGYVWKGITKADANKFIRILMTVHDANDLYDCRACGDRSNWADVTCKKCGQKLNSGRVLLKPNFNPTSYHPTRDLICSIMLGLFVTVLVILFFAFIGTID
ncbi:MULTISPECIES: hypothetical protein [unclassified Methylophaga]|uniref:hypothetical protein n=1 Tax=unclassified Methylophaga TaxID=2629249 RepID=UPI000C91490F|nr:MULTISPECIES: hypothetical protein [unclassified Methylophaga]MBN46296.1 hypothetical protein [Methylophaga sp.]|tara:strand:- start:44627 stop:45121 length:495 start_codon:yes stop_codon:yes gene_type:complete